MEKSGASGRSTESMKRPALKPLEKRYERMYGKKLAQIIVEQAPGPKYDVYEGCFILNPSYNWGTNNLSGEVPVVVNKELLEGNGQHLPLKEEQKDGIRFLWDNFTERKGGILAHGTGTGKTRTGITFIATLVEQSSKSPGTHKPGITRCIILAPKNGVSVWADEFKKWCPSSIPCNYDVITPGQKDGWEVVDKFLSPEPTPNILILSYESFQKYNSGYKNHGFAAQKNAKVDLVICDEAHMLKNLKTQRVESLKKFKEHSVVWFGFTATPFQNNLEEICNLVDLFRSEVFSGINYKEDYCKPIQSVLSKKGKLQKTSKAMEKMRNLCRWIRPSLHFKSIELPNKQHIVTLCVPLDGHPKYYSPEDSSTSLQHEMYKQICAEVSCGFYDRIHILNKLLISPRYCAEGALDKSKHSTAFQKVKELYNRRVEGYDFELKPELEGMLSSKINAVTHLAKKLKSDFPDEKMVIVSSSRVLLLKVKKMFASSGGMKVVEFDGDKTEQGRKDNLKAFDEENSIQFLLLSLKAGGTALTLIRANHLVLLDPDYNPANDKQALGRINRLGQTRPVYIYRILSTGTMDEAKYILQLSKEELENCVASDKDNGVQAPFNVGLTTYNEETDSLVQDTITDQNWDEDEGFASTFAEELEGAQTYSEYSKVPDTLPLVKYMWEHVPVSLAFHIATIPDEACEELASELENSVPQN